MIKNFIIICCICFALNSFAQRENLIIETDSIKIFDTHLSKTTLNNLSPVFYNNGVIYNSAHNSNKYSLVFSDFKNNPEIIKTGPKFQLGKVAIYTNEIYFTGKPKQSDLIFDVQSKIYKGILKEGKITKVQQLDICKREYNYGHPSLSIDGKTMVITTNEKGIYHLLVLKRNDENKWVKNDVAYITSRNFALINPTIFDENTIYFSSNMKNGKLHGISRVNQNGKMVIDELIYEEDSFNLYKVEKNNGRWSIPKKVHVLNSDFDDLDVLFINKKSGYITTSRFDNNDNIFYFELKY